MIKKCPRCCQEVACYQMGFVIDLTGEFYFNEHFDLDGNECPMSGEIAPEEAS